MIVIFSKNVGHLIDTFFLSRYEKRKSSNVTEVAVKHFVILGEKRIMSRDKEFSVLENLLF